LLGDGRVLCWGSDSFGQIGNAPTGDDFIALHSGGVYSCGVRADNTIYCWGSTAEGILDVPLDPVLSLVTGWDAACVEVEEGVYECWGNDTSGKYSGRPSEPVRALQIGWQQGCALLENGSIDCWGENDYGQATPPAGTDFVAISLASWHGCAQHENGSLQCWGSTTNAPSGAVKSMSSRGLSTCAILMDDSVRCWGSGGALDPPTDISAQKLAVGDGHSCALLTDGSITCWGYNPDGAHIVPTPE
jgi:alpha-tubulin suppressor-like RCC1 family protein